MASVSTHQEQALRLFQAFEKGTPAALDSMLELFSEAANFFMWGPHKPPMAGRAAMREGFTEMFKQLRDFRYRISNTAENGNILFVERVEHFTFMEKHNVTVNLVSVSELGSDGKFVSWTDYFDSSILTQLE